MLLIADHSFNNVSLLNRNDYLEQKVSGLDDPDENVSVNIETTFYS
jgi:hypothetical protein